MKKYLVLFLALSLILSGCAGSSAIRSDNIAHQGAPKAPVQSDLAEFGPIITDFGLALLRDTYTDGTNTLISPFSVITALAMTAGGARENTLVQMESVLGADEAVLDAYLGSYIAHLRGLPGENLHIANSIWFTDDPVFSVQDSFLQQNAAVYGADIFRTPFDNTTLQDINSWTDEATHGMIPKILDQIPEDAVMYLINALAFEAQWQKPYEDYQVRTRDFTTESGAVIPVEMMYSSEHHYLETENAQGFLKYYKDRRYAFAVLLPREGCTVEQVLDSLTGEELHALLTQTQDELVEAGIPKFETVYDTDLGPILMDMGMADAFDWKTADFSGLGTATDGRNICISRVLHSTCLTVAEQGTRAGAATAVEMEAAGAAPGEIQPKTVILDRPFLYLIIDTEYRQPLFLGVLMEP